MSQAAELRDVVLHNRYRLVRRLASGGMAEIYLARQSSLAGFEKPLVVKILQERYRGEAMVRKMFLDEARIGALLNHPHIVHVYDVAEHEGLPFIAMELIDGEELSLLCRRGIELAHFLPLEHAVELIRQAAAGMGFFHAARDEHGEPLGIVHRDISPSNLLITRDGVLKIIDFGIADSAFAETSGGEEASGASRRPSIEKRVPGKHNYMSPEQVRGDKVDQRSDIYSLGIVLYEITVGRRLYKGRPETVMRKIVHERVKPPTFIRKGFPPHLESIIMRALEPHPADRFTTAYELASELEDFLRETGLKSGPVRIARYLDSLEERSGRETRPELSIAGEAWLDDEGEDALDFDRDYEKIMKEAAARSAEPEYPAGPTVVFSEEKDEPAAPGEPPLEAPPRRRTPPPEPPGKAIAERGTGRGLGVWFLMVLLLAAAFAAVFLAVQ